MNLRFAQAATAFVQVLFFSILGALAAIGCARNASQNGVIIGTTTKSELLAKLGKPSSTQNADTDRSIETVTYPDATRFQLENDRVTAAFRDPVGDEVKLQYWRIKWKDTPTSMRKLASSSGCNQSSELRAPSFGQSVIFNAATGDVLRVVDYEKK